MNAEKEKENARKVAKLIELCSRIACIVDTDGRNDTEEEHQFLKELNMGYRALSGYLRAGCLAVLELQDGYYHAKENEVYAKAIAQEKEDFLRDIFGDADIDSINEKDKQRFMELAAQIEADAVSREKGTPHKAHDGPAECSQQ